MTGAGGPAPGAPGDADGHFMDRALSLARRGWGQVSPNPLVGAVIVRDGAVVGEGWHRRYGGDHAEVAALGAAGDDARGATVYVNLEPCAHQGKTPPCTRALAGAGVRRVVVGCRDPHPDANGGIEVLRTRGIRVDVGVRGEAAARLNAPFLWRHARGGPFAVLKLALSLDGRIAASEGVRSAVTGEEAWGWVHRIRARHDAVLVGARTARIDDPRLTARGAVEPRRPAVRVVLDTDLSLPPDSRLARTAREVPVWVVGGEEAPADRAARLEAAGVRVLGAETGERGFLRPGAVLERLGREGVGSVLVEGGGQVAASFLRAGCLQRMFLLYAPVVFGSGGVEGFPGPGPERDGWEPAGRAALGPDTRITLESADLRELCAEMAREPAGGAA